MCLKEAVERFNMQKYLGNSLFYLYFFQINSNILFLKIVILPIPKLSKLVHCERIIRNKKYAIDFSSSVLTIYGDDS